MNAAEQKAARIKKQFDDLKAENERLRAALERIKKVYDNVEDLAGVIAKEALNP